jgi:hypothetical protein
VTPDVRESTAIVKSDSRSALAADCLRRTVVCMSRAGRTLLKLEECGRAPCTTALVGPLFANVQRRDTVPRWDQYLMVHSSCIVLCHSTVESRCEARQRSDGGRCPAEATYMPDSIP